MSIYMYYINILKINKIYCNWNPRGIPLDVRSGINAYKLRNHNYCS